MILLDKSCYSKCIEQVKKVKINHLFALAILQNQVDGFVYVDDMKNPKTFYIVHPYGMSLLFGENENETFNAKLFDYILNTNKFRKKCEWMQVFPDTWNKKIMDFFGKKLVKSSENSENAKVVEYIRVNFKFNSDKYQYFKKEICLSKFNIQRTSKAMYENMDGTVIPKYFWKNADHFCNDGIGFSLVAEGKAVSTAYSAFIIENQLELGIETNENYRGKGYALYTCSALIDYCLKNDYEPIWACRLENTASYKLAQKLGFEPTVFIPFYKLNV